MESECFVVAAIVVFLYCGCNQFNLLKRVVNVSQLFCFQRKKEQEMETKKKEKEEKISFGDTLSSSTGQRPTDEEVALGLFSLTQLKMKTLLQASIIDSENHSSSKLFTLNCKQNLLDTEPFLLAL